MICAIKYNDILEAKRTINLELIKKDITQDQIKQITFDKKTTDLFSELNSFDLFDTTRATIVFNADFLSNLKSFNESIEIIKILNESELTQDVYLLTDSKFLSNKEFKTITSNFTFIEQKPLDARQKQVVINDLLSQKNIKLDKDVYATLISNVDCSFGVIKNEIEKLKNGIEAGLNNEQLKDLICNYNEEVIFGLLDSILEGKNQLAWKIYEDLLRHRQDEFKIIAAISSQLFNMYNCLTLIKQNVPTQKISDVTGVVIFVINNVYKKNFINYNIDKILNLITKLYQLDVDIKNQRVDQRLGLKQFLLNI